MRIKGQEDARQPFTRANLLQFTQQRLMAAMDAVKVANGQGSGAAQLKIR
jgi:hypothetical protein